MSEKISIIVPFYNASRYIKKTLESIELQNISKKIYIVNDGSSANELERLKKIIKNHNNIVLIQKENGGLSSARNIGIEQATGEYLIFLDADDLLGYGQLEKQIEKIETDDAELCIAKYSIANESLSQIKNQPSYMGEGLSMEYFCAEWEKGISIPIHSVVFKRNTLSDLRFDEELKSKEDYDFWIKLFKTNRKIAYISRYMPIYRVSKKSMARGRILSMNEMYKVVENHISSTENEKFKTLLASNYRHNYGIWNVI